MRRKLIIATLCVSLQPTLSTMAQPPSGTTLRMIFDKTSAEARARYEADAVRLWNGRAPGAQGDTPEDLPLLYPLLPAQGQTPTGAILVLPGGAYEYLAAAESFPIAEMYRDAGLAAFVLKYRLRPQYDPMVHPLADAQRAMRVIRARARQFNVDRLLRRRTPGRQSLASW